MSTFLDDLNQSASLILLGPCYSKANTKRVYLNRKTGRRIYGKADHVLIALESFIVQAKKQWQRREPLWPPIAIYIDIHYQSRKPDLDESLVLETWSAEIDENSTLDT